MSGGVSEGALLCTPPKYSRRLLNLKESAANHCAFQMSNNSAQFSPCSLLPALLLASALNPRKRISQTHLSSQDHSTARPCQRNPALFSPRGVSIKGSVKFLNELLIDGDVEGTMETTGTLTIGEHACIRGEIRTKSVKVQGIVEGNICVTERCEPPRGLHAAW